MSSATVTRADGDGRSVAATGTGSSAPTQGSVLAGSSGPVQPRLSVNGGVADATAVSGVAKADASRPSTFKAGSPPRPVVGAQKIITKILAIQSQTSAVGVAAVPPRLALTAPAAGTGHDGGAGATVAPSAAAGSGGAGAGAGAGGGAPLTAVAEGAVVDGATTTQDEEEALWRDAMAARRGTVISFEFFPAKTERGVSNLLRRIREMSTQLKPTFVTLTWRSAFTDESLWLRLGSRVQRDIGVDVLLHLTCHLPIVDLKRILRRVREAGLRNILALRGDPPIGQEKWRPVPGGLNNAIDLVRLIREEHGDYFCVAVAGYPEAHIECWNSSDLPPSEQSKALDLQRLKQKIDAGADFVVTQFFYDVPAFLEFRNRCRTIGITCPILPGHMVVQGFGGFKKFTTWCKTRVPPRMMADLDAIKEDGEAVKAYGVKIGTEVCRQLLAEGTQALHFYTMNLSLSVRKILRALGMIPPKRDRAVPWKVQNRIRGGSDEVRPIFWNNRAASYLARTSAWDEFPNGRWGDNRSAAYGSLSDYYLSSKRPKVNRRALWGVPQSKQDVVDVFVGYVEGRVEQLPWCEQAIDKQGESGYILEGLKWLNSHGFLTINSQPKVNGAPSTDKMFGWGGAGGYVFQKAYMEFFVDPETFTLLMDRLGAHPTLTYHAVNFTGAEYTNADPCHANAVTWGVFPDREIIQPTIVDPVSFRAWKTEAFELWESQWASVYDGDSAEDAAARDLIRRVRDTYWLVNVVDNAYADEDSDIFAVFRSVVWDSMDRGQLLGVAKRLERENAAMRQQLLKMGDYHAHASTELEAKTKELAASRAANARLEARVRELESRMLLKPTISGL